MAATIVCRPETPEVATPAGQSEQYLRAIFLARMTLARGSGHTFRPHRAAFIANKKRLLVRLGPASYYGSPFIHNR